jgi:hypothetical protein
VSKPIKFSVSYSTTKSWKYQSINVGGTIELELEPGNKIADEITRWRKSLANQVDTEADARIRDLAAAMEGDV